MIVPSIEPLALSKPTTCPPKHPRLDSNSSCSIFLAFKVAQLVNTFRTRVKSRVLCSRQSRRNSIQLQEELCQDYEEKAFTEIDNYLEQRHVYSPERCRSKTIGFKAPKDESNEPSWQKSFSTLLTQLQQESHDDERSLVKVAADSSALLQHDYTFDRGRLTQRDLKALLSLVHSLLATIKAAHGYCYLGDRFICSGQEVAGADEIFLANLEHLLLCLQHELLLAVVSKGWLPIDQHIIECQRDQERRSETWFFEFPDARHPLSTTMPWCIKPSLAVLWGVCWMFYYIINNEGHLVNENGEIVMGRDQVAQFWNQGGIAQPSGEMQGPDAESVPRTPIPMQPEYMNLQAAAYTPQPQYPANIVTSAGGSDNSSSPDIYLSGHDTYNAYPTSPSLSTASGQTSGITGITDEYADLRLPRGDGSSYDQTWNQYNSNAAQGTQGFFTRAAAPTSHPAVQPSPHVNAYRVTPPTISLTTSGLPPPGPTDIYSSGLEFSSSAHTDPLSATLSPGHLPYWATPEIIGTPGSFTSQAASMLSPSSRPRARSDPTSPLPRSPSVALSSTASIAVEGTPPPRGRSVFSVDHGSPPENEHEQIICTYDPKCAGVTFPRRCEWSKHMDKHTRPYRCRDQDCQKLPGFTYSGGLLRHQREVHKKWGGVKKKLFCPYPECKRHTGEGFSRQENLQEHRRRVHKDSGPPPDTDLAPTSVKAEAETPTDTPFSETPEAAITLRRYSAEKRKRVDSSCDPSTDGEQVREQVKRLKDENLELQQKMVEMTKRLAQLEEGQRTS